MADKRIGLFFGSFNPVHNGHLMIANYLAESGELDQLWFVISPRSPFKDESALIADYHRRELLMRAIGDYPRFRVSSVEFQLPKPSFTIDTLDFLKLKYPDYQLILIMGSDQLPGFHLWKEYDRILSDYRILVYPRRGSDDPEIVTPDYQTIKIVDAPILEISSTSIRESVKLGKDVRFFMPVSAWQYLEEMHFYR